MINHGLWTAFEENKISREQVVNTRFSTLCKEYGIEKDGKLLEAEYRTYLNNGHQLIDGAIEVIKTLAVTMSYMLLQMAYRLRNISAFRTQVYILILKKYLFQKIRAFKTYEGIF